MNARKAHSFVSDYVPRTEFLSRCTGIVYERESQTLGFRVGITRKLTSRATRAAEGWLRPLVCGAYQRSIAVAVWALVVRSLFDGKCYYYERMRVSGLHGSTRLGWVGFFMCGRTFVFTEVEEFPCRASVDLQRPACLS